MIPIVLFQNAPGILQFFQLVVTWLRILRNKRIANEEFMQFMQIMFNFFRMIMIWLDLVLILLRWLDYNRKKNRLFKPHLLIRLLGGYRFCML